MSMYPLSTMVPRLARDFPSWGLLLISALILFFFAKVSHAGIWDADTKRRLKTLKPKVEVHYKPSAKDKIWARKKLNVKGRIQYFPRVLNQVIFENDKKVSSAVYDVPSSIDQLTYTKQSDSAARLLFLLSFSKEEARIVVPAHQGCKWAVHPSNNFIAFAATTKCRPTPHKWMGIARLAVPEDSQLNFSATRAEWFAPL